MHLSNALCGILASFGINSVNKKYSNYLSLLKVYLNSVELNLNGVIFFGLSSKFYTI